MTGFALATVCNLVLFPISSRTVTFRDAAAYISALQAALKAQSVYILKLELEEVMMLDLQVNDGKKKDTGLSQDYQRAARRASGETKILQGCVKALTAVHGKMYGDLAFAKRETALGCLDADDIEEMFKLLRSVMVPLTGINTVVDIFTSMAEQPGRTRGEADIRETEASTSGKKDEREELSDFLQSLQAPFKALIDIMLQGLDHGAIQLDLIPKKHRDPRPVNKDLEVGSDGSEPGSARFVDHLQSQVNQFYSARGSSYNYWSHDAGFSGAKSTSATPERDNASRQIREHKLQQQRYLGLYVSQIRVTWPR